MDDARGRRLGADGQVQTPVAYLTCNFTEPATIDGKLQPSLFTHDEVITLFHEFGHGLHHMLTQVDEIGVSGIAGVEWDAVELPSQFMENFCWEWEVLSHMTAHVDSGEPLPRALYDKMLAAKNFQSGMQTLRQVEFSLLDMHLHFDFDPAGTQSVQDMIDDVRRKFSIVAPPAFNRFQNSFGHIFAGGYAAGYYSYKWAEVLSADAYAAFEEAAVLGNGVLCTETGKRFQQEILAVGGSRPALESFTPSVAANRRSTPCCATAAWRLEHDDLHRPPWPRTVYGRLAAPQRHGGLSIMAARAALAVLLMLATATAGAQVYKWKDDKGVTHFSDTPPPCLGPGKRPN